MPVASCPTCGKRLPKKARFCPECGTRVSDPDDQTVAEEVPLHETGPVPVHVTAAPARFFGVTPPMAVFGLTIAALVLAIALFAAGHLVWGSLLLVLAGVFLALFVAAARRLPETPVVRLSTDALEALRARAGFAVEAVAAHSSARVEVFRLQRELADLHVQWEAALRDLGEAVYREDSAGTDAARERVRSLDEETGAKEAEMQRIAANAQERVERAHLRVQPTEVIEPEPPMPVPEPSPVPSEPTPVPPNIPEPSPVPHEPPPSIPVPEPGPAPAPVPPDEQET